MDYQPLTPETTGRKWTGHVLSLLQLTAAVGSIYYYAKDYTDADPNVRAQMNMWMFAFSLGAASMFTALAYTVLRWKNHSPHMFKMVWNAILSLCWTVVVGFFARMFLMGPDMFMKQACYFDFVNLGLWLTALVGAVWKWKRFQRYGYA